MNRRSDFISLCRDCGLTQDNYCGRYNNLVVLYFESETDVLSVWNCGKFIEVNSYIEAKDLITDTVNFQKELELKHKQFVLELKIEKIKEDFK